MTNSKQQLELRFPLHNMMEEITSYENVSESFDYVVGHLECKRQRDKIRKKKERYVNALIDQLSAGTFHITGDDFRTLTVTDGPKARTVQAPRVFHRIGCHAIMVVVEKYTYQTMILNTASSIKNRGMHWLHYIVERDLNDNPSLKYYYQCDLYRYYDSIRQDLMKLLMCRYTDEDKLLKMLNNFIELLPPEQGVSKGLRSSQCYANLFLSDIDHVLIERTPYYYRYCDDIVILAPTKEELWAHRNCLTDMLKETGLRVKQNEAVRPTSVGIDFLGYVTFTDDTNNQRVVYSKIRKRTKQKFARRICRVKSRKRRKAIIGSFFGMAAHGDCRHLLKTFLTRHEFNKLKHKRKMKEFGDFNVKPTTINGKKSFRGQCVSSSELDRKGVIIVDYEKDVIPRREKDAYSHRLQVASSQGIDINLVEKPRTRTIISLIHDGKMRKLWTGDQEIVQTLEQIDAENGFPFFAGIEVDYSGQHKKINFVPASKLELTVPSDEEVERLYKTYNIKQR